MPDLNDALQVEIDELKARLRLVITRAERAEGELKDLRSRMYDCQQGGRPCPHCSNTAELEGEE